MNESRIFVEDIKTHSLALGILADEALESAGDLRYMAGLACLFILVEQCVKLCCNSVDGNFNDKINQLLENKLITSEEYVCLNLLRKVRNTLFHENHYGNALVGKDNKVTLLGEHEAKERLWAELSFPILNICNRLLQNQ